ncbi:MAG: hemerythrin family protein [Magnetococcales bacterium]|nr:hemerythrin family protein [Magnetococcales bacterium]
MNKPQITKQLSIQKDLSAMNSERVVEPSWYFQCFPLDEDHQHLYALINDLDESINNDNSREVSLGIIDELINFTIWHFGHENYLMLQHDYPDRLHHHNTHDYLTNKILIIKCKANSGEADLSADLIVLLLEWLTAHILVEDKKLADFLNARDANKS